MTIELELDLHLGMGHQFAADRAGRSDPGTAEPTVGASRGELSGPDSFSRLLSATGVVRDGPISGRTLAWASYRGRHRPDELARAAQGSRAHSSPGGSEATSSPATRRPRPRPVSGRWAHRRHHMLAPGPQRPRYSTPGLAADGVLAACGGLVAERGPGPPAQVQFLDIGRLHRNGSIPWCLPIAARDSHSAPAFPQHVCSCINGGLAGMAPSGTCTTTAEAKAVGALRESATADDALCEAASPCDAPATRRVTCSSATTSATSRTICAHNEARICVAARQEQVVSAGASWWTILDLNQ